MLVYLATFPNNKCYVGCTSMSLSQRQRGHKHKALTEKLELPLYRAIRKYGWESITWSILFETESYSEMLIKEKDLIIQYKSKLPFGYNVTDGGEGTIGFSSWNKGVSPSPSTLEKMRLNNLFKAKKTVIIDTELKLIHKFNTVKEASIFLNASYSVIKLARTNNRDWFKYKVLQEEYFNSLDKKELFKLKPVHNAKAIVLTNGIEIRKYNSISLAYKELNISERKMRNIVYKNACINGWSLCQDI